MLAASVEASRVYAVQKKEKVFTERRQGTATKHYVSTDVLRPEIKTDTNAEERQTTEAETGQMKTVTETENAV